MHGDEKDNEFLQYSLEMAAPGKRKPAMTKIMTDFVPDRAGKPKTRSIDGKMARASMQQNVE